MLSHALTIVTNELEKHLDDTYGQPVVAPQVRLGNIAEGVGNSAGNPGAVSRDVLSLSMVNIREEKTLKNVSTHVRNDAALSSASGVNRMSATRKPQGTSSVRCS